MYNNKYMVMIVIANLYAKLICMFLMTPHSAPMR